MSGFLVLLAFLASSAQAAPRNTGRKVPKPAELLKCKPAAAGKEESRAREAAEALNFSDHEALSRLVFAEALSTGFWSDRCKAPSAAGLMEAIAWGILNRVEKFSPNREDPKPDAFFHVIFAPKQFSTSFSAKGDNPFAKSFLCPLEANKYFEKIESDEEAYDVYVLAKEVSSRIIEFYQRKGIDPVYSRISNFFYPYSEFGGASRPSWAKNADPAKNKGYVNLWGGEKPCVEFYRR